MVLHWCGTYLMYQAILALKVITITVVSSQVPSLLSWWGWRSVCLSVCHAIGRVRVGRVTAVRRTSPLTLLTILSKFRNQNQTRQTQPANTSKQPNRCERERDKQNEKTTVVYTLSLTHIKRSETNETTSLTYTNVLYSSRVNRQQDGTNTVVNNNNYTWWSYSYDFYESSLKP